MKPEQNPKQLPKAMQWALVAVVLCLFLWNGLPGKTRDTADMTSDEQRIASALSLIEGAGKTHVVIYKSEDANALPIGAVIVSEGAGDLFVQWQLSLAAETLLSLNADQIRIFPMEETP